MAYKPILFNTEMVKAILDGRKTQTRRLVKNIPLQEPYFEVVDGTPYACDGDGEWHPSVEFSPIQKGDVLYVRETFCGYYLPSPERWPEGHMHYVYKASNPNGNRRPTGPEYDDGLEERPWRPSIHMPRSAARLFLQVNSVRIERLRCISEQDAISEGITRLFDYLTDDQFARIIAPYDSRKKDEFGWTNYLYKKDANHLYSDYESPIDSFASLWDSTVKPSDLPQHGWEVNPFVWVYEFERCEKPDDF